MHQASYDRGGSQAQIDMTLALAVDGRLGFLQIDAGSREERSAAAAAAVRASSAKAIRRDPATARFVALVDVDGLDMADGDMFRLFEH